MKKVFYFAAALFAATSCAEVGVDDATPNIDGSTTEIVITVAASDAVDSRVAIDDEWNVTWVDGESLMACTMEDTSSELTMTDYDPNNSTFTGDVASETFRLISPYSVDAVVSGGLYTADISAQSAGMSATHLISSAVVSDIDSTPYMMHIGAAMTLEATFANIEADASYTLSAIELVDVISAADISLSLEGVNYSNQVVGNIMISDIDASISTESTTSSVKFNILPFEVGAGESVEVNLYLEDATGASYTVPSSVSNSGSTAVAFNRATYNTLKVTADLETAVSTSATMTLSEISADNIPTVDTWIFTDESATAVATYAGLQAALAAIGDTREISIIFPNLSGKMPNYAMWGVSNGIGTSDAPTETQSSYALVSISAPNVTEVGNYAFASFRNLKNIDMPLLATTNTGSFYYCTALESISLPAATSLGGSSFKNCSSLTSAYLPAIETAGTNLFNAAALTYLELATNAGTTLSSINSNSFGTSANINLVLGEANAELVTGTTLTAGGKSATFKSITIGDNLYLSILAIDADNIPDSDTWTIVDETIAVGNYAGLCAAIQKLSLEGERKISLEFPYLTSFINSAMSADSSVDLTNVDMSALVSVYAPEALSIGNTSFRGCNGLVTIDAEKVESVGQNGMAYCYSLTDVNLPSATSLAGAAFTYCTSLVDIELESVESILYAAFRYCTSLESVKLPSLTSLGGDNIFNNITTLKSIEIATGQGVVLDAVAVGTASSGVYKSNTFGTAANIDLKIGSLSSSLIGDDDLTLTFANSVADASPSEFTFTFNSVATVDNSVE